MLLRQLTVVLIASAFLFAVGCQKEAADEHLLEVAVKQEQQKGEIDSIATRIEGFEKRLDEIAQSLEKTAPPTGATQPPKVGDGETTEPKIVEFKDTPEYGQIAAQLAAIQQRLTLTRSNLTETRQETAREEQLRRLRDPAEASRVMGNPQELTNRLGNFARSYVQRIEDPARRQQFELDVERLKRKFSENLSAQERYQRTVSALTERLNNEENERTREYLQGEIRSLETASAEELAGRLDRYQRYQTMRDLRQLQSTYDIPREAYRDAGLPFMGRGMGR